MAATVILADLKDKAAPKTAKGAINKEREATAQQQHNETEVGEAVHG